MLPLHSTSTHPTSCQMNRQAIQLWQTRRFQRAVRLWKLTILRVKQKQHQLQSDACHRTSVSHISNETCTDRSSGLNLQFVRIQSDSESHNKAFLLQTSGFPDSIRNDDKSSIAIESALLLYNLGTACRLLGGQRALPLLRLAGALWNKTQEAVQHDHPVTILLQQEIEQATAACIPVVHHRFYTHSRPLLGRVHRSHHTSSNISSSLPRMSHSHLAPYPTSSTDFLETAFLLTNGAPAA